MRGKSTRRPPVLTHLPDGSYLSDLDGLPVRIIEADLTVTGADGSRVRDRYRLITTLLDHRPPSGGRAGPALPRTLGDRVGLPGAAPHHARRARAALRGPGRARAGGLGAADALPAAAHGHGRRGRDPPRHQPRPGQLHHRPADRPRPAHRRRPGSPTDQPGQPVQPDLLGVIGRAVLATLLPARRARYSARKVKCATSRYLNRDDRRPAPADHHHQHRGHPAHPSIDATLATPIPQAARPARRPQPAATASPRSWTTIPAAPGAARELADKLGIKPRNMLTQLAEWTRLGFLTRTHAGTYQLPTRRDTASP